VGDVALQRGHSHRIESVHNAQDTADRAASAIMGKVPPKDQAPWFWSDQYDVNLQSAGIVPTGDDDVYQINRPGENVGSVSFWSYSDRELIAVDAVRDPKNFMLGKKCLEKIFHLVDHDSYYNNFFKFLSYYYENHAAKSLMC